ncbi:family 20 glycosylhydrolase (plasmid) [Hymenobacter tibetensis]|uniref:beta-N-acetylhexosaminidase n=1 Tax=Hymenobacter tibetensis TaxID=497967 RepID=A0ABY4D877_9BACT|nr:family 20 glycosylhydrolase [Hymenobacter tibetensis]UOG77441.1 family 20 glycosylhydrolase [Hymenobacter tibetensis]
MSKKTLASFAASLGLIGSTMLATGPAYSQQPITSQQTIAIIPQPARLTAGSGSFAITAGTKIYVDAKNAELNRIGQTLSQEIKKAAGVQPQVVPAVPGKRATGGIYLTLLEPVDTLGTEGYKLSVQPTQVVLAASKPQGVFMGMQSIRQLLPTQGAGATASLPAVEIVDEPRYEWRGMHLDVCRHFFSVDFVKKYIDYLAMHKLNTFHWHLTDDQGWRIEIKKYPKLTEIGAWRDGSLIGRYTNAKADSQYDNIRHGGFYTQEQIKEVVKYAQDRYITVVPEIEMPGHAVAALAGYPELSCTGGPFKVERTWGVFDDIFCAGNEQTFTFLQDVLSEVMPLFPSKIIHIGGDEAPKTRWKTCPKCQARIKTEHLKDEHELQSYFVQRMEKFVNSKGKTIIGWDEILEGGLAPNAAVMSWRGMEGGIAAAKQKHNVVMTPGSHVYIDYAQDVASVEPLSIGGYLPLSKVYSFEPTPKDLTAEEKKYIIGGQANLWTEYIGTEKHVEYMVFPRMSALAEVVWTPASEKNWPSFKERMQTQYQRYEAMGANYARSAFTVRQELAIDTVQHAAMVSMQSDATGPQLVYTLDGSEPTAASQVYTAPFAVPTSAVIKAASFENGKRVGRVTTTELTTHKAFASPLKLASAPNKRYQGKGVLTLVDGQKGSTSSTDGQWLGFSGTDLVATLDLNQATEINTVKSSFLRNEGSEIFLPTNVEIAVSKDGKKFKPVYSKPVTAASEGKGPNITEVKADFKKTKARFVRITAKIAPPAPASAGAKKAGAWLFADEIVVQ